MGHTDETDRPCYSLWLIRPFLAALRERTEIASGLEKAVVLEPDDRVPIEVVHRVLEAAVYYCGDEDLGLKAARHLRFGDAGAIDYLVRSVETVEDAIKVATRYMRLVNDALNVRFHVDEQRVTVQLDNSIAMPRAATDFQVAGIYQTHLRLWLTSALSDLRIFLPHPSPADTSEYEKTFAPATVCFDAPLCGYNFEKSVLQAPLEKADPSLYHVLRKQAEQMLSQLPRTQSLSQKVRDVLAAELGQGNPTAPYVARRLGMSTSTLGRRLEREGESFKDLLDDLRKQLATQYLTNPNLELAEVALLLGFSQSSAFHRAFRRWTGQTPAEYRRRYREY